jgi:myo-inositol 2-dehydrogenase / D-chiro-inositol 1-dehydrogenase
MIGIALLGAGRMARVHAKAIGAAGGRLVTVYDVVEAAAKSLAAETGASVAPSIKEALHHPEVDAVLVGQRHGWPKDGVSGGGRRCVAQARAGG